MNWTFYLFSVTGGTLHTETFKARDAREADIKGARLYRKIERRFDPTEVDTWVVEPFPVKTASQPVFTGPSTKRKRIDRQTLEGLEAGPVASRTHRIARKLVENH